MLNPPKTLSLGERSRQLSRKHIKLPDEVNFILQQKAQLEANIQLIERRLVCGTSSEPLSATLLSLIREDMMLSCQLTDLLVQMS
jgi:hypothetical protein